MNADSISMHIDIAPIDRLHLVLAQHAEDAIRGLLRIVQQRLGVIARYERAVAQVITIRKDLARDAQLGRLSGAG